MVTSVSSAAAAASQLQCASAASVRLSVTAPFLDGIQCFLDGAIVVAGVAHGLVGVYWICGCSSSGTGNVLHSSRSAFDCVFPFLDGVSKSACVLSILKLGGLWFLAGPFQKAKVFVSRGNSRSFSLQASGSVLAESDDLLVQGSGKRGIVSSLPVGLEQASGRVDLTVPRSKRQQHLQALFVPDQESWMLFGSVRSRRAKFNFFEGLSWAYQGD